MAHDPRILISGASIAGPTLAYWLVRHGFRPTVVERSPALRPGGNGVDIRGSSVRIAERMGVLPRLRERATDIRGLTFVDAADRRVAGMSTRIFNADGDIEIMRGDLAEVLYEATADDGFYFDAVSQVRLPAWSSGRVALVGDAGYCATLLSGAGAALAIEGAHLLATELAAAGGDHRIAFHRYEQALRPTVPRAQRSVRASSSMLIPATGGHIWLRNQLTRLMVLQTLASRVYRPVAVRAA
jgi:2-polyprenyl-6-methoxyphenol hydroxylase-like FAD-dependent oxidoreductase